MADHSNYNHIFPPNPDDYYTMTTGENVSNNNSSGQPRLGSYERDGPRRFNMPQTEYYSIAVEVLSPIRQTENNNQPAGETSNGQPRLYPIEHGYDIMDPYSDYLVSSSSPSSRPISQTENYNIAVESLNPISQTENNNHPAGETSSGQRSLYPIEHDYDIMDPYSDNWASSSGPISRPENNNIVLIPGGLGLYENTIWSDQFVSRISQTENNNWLAGETSSGQQRLYPIEHGYDIMDPYSTSISQTENNYLFHWDDNQYNAMINQFSNIGLGGVETNRLLSMLSSLNWLILENNMNILFPNLVDGYRDQQLSSVVDVVLSNRRLFLNAVFNKNESIYILELIKEIKRTGVTEHASTVTRVLSTKFYDIMTNYGAKIVILNCLNHFGNKPNEVLHEQAIFYFKELAINGVGCRSLNSCIDAISGEQKKKLLNCIAAEAAYLANHPYGNYVVQHVIELQDIVINKKILDCLKDQFIELAKKIAGSHIVEKCLECSDRGTHVVVEKILACPNDAFVLAKDDYGNFVIQTALKLTKRKGIQKNVFSRQYKSLVNALTPFAAKLRCSPGGKKVMTLIKDLEIEPQRQNSFTGRGAANLNHDRNRVC